MTAHLLAKFSSPVPRYTSYPTAPHFSTDVGERDARSWITALPEGADVSLYLHVPFCQQLCWYCGCSTKVVNRYEPIAHYVTALEREIETVAALMPKGHRVTHIHWGGGSPNVLEAMHIERLLKLLRSRFVVADGAEIAIEIDPRGLDEARITAMAEGGVTRISFGVQDFNEDVQIAINRVQSFELTERAVAAFRAHGIASINIDLVYGLPHQTSESVRRTIDLVRKLDPDRIATFAYAHLPDRIKHQRLISDAALPGTEARHEQGTLITELLLDAGYQRVGLDHFAKSHDQLSAEPISRNFQGYTTDAADALIGLGATSISKLPQGYLQNEVDVKGYTKRVLEGHLATVRGVALSEDDRVRAAVIERLMCTFDLSAEALRVEFGESALPVLSEAEALIADDHDELLERTRDGFRVREPARPFVRSICARFDAYLGRGTARHAPGV